MLDSFSLAEDIGGDMVALWGPGSEDHLRELFKTWHRRKGNEQLWCFWIARGGLIHRVLSWSASGLVATDDRIFFFSRWSVMARSRSPPSVP
jgi:hypothetical protein